MESAGVGRKAGQDAAGGRQGCISGFSKGQEADFQVARAYFRLKRKKSFRYIVKLFNELKFLSENRFKFSKEKVWILNKSAYICSGHSKHHFVSIC